MVIDNLSHGNKIKNPNKNIVFIKGNVKDFDLNFVRGLSLEDGLSTLTDFTAFIIYDSIIKEFNSIKDNDLKIFVCGGGRKNLFLIDVIKKKLSNNIQLNLLEATSNQRSQLFSINSLN